MLRILDLIGEGLGLKPGYFDGELSKTQLLSINHHVPCPDPSLTIGMPEHRDPNLLSMLQQCSVPGLQVFFQGQWMNIEPMENAFFVIPGMLLKVYYYSFHFFKNIPRLKLIHFQLKTRRLFMNRFPNFQLTKVVCLKYNIIVTLSSNFWEN